MNIEKKTIERRKIEVADELVNRTNKVEIEKGTKRFAPKKNKKKTTKTATIIIACYLTEDEMTLLEQLKERTEKAVSMGGVNTLFVPQKSKRMLISKAETIRTALLYFAANPSEVYIPPRARYRRDVRGVARMPFTITRELLNELTGWMKDYSASSNQVIRHAIRQYAKCWGICITSVMLKSDYPEEWNRLKICSADAARLASTSRAVINSNAKLEKYSYTRNERGYHLYNLLEIAEYYRIPKKRVDGYMKEWN